MHRRDALKALVALPAVARISCAELKPGDVLVVECDEDLSADSVQRIKETMTKVWPGRRVVVFDKSMRLKIVPGSEVSG